MTTQFNSAGQMVFIDGALDGINAILAGMAPGMEVIILNPAQDGLRQIAAALAGRSQLTAIHIISHSASGALQLGAATLNAGNLAPGSFVAGTTPTALDGNDYLLYNTTTGALSYDADGNGGTAAIQFATLTGNPNLNAADFGIV